MNLVRNLRSVLSGCLLICGIAIGCRPESSHEPTTAPELTATFQEQEAIQPTPTRSTESSQPTALSDLTPTMEGSETSEVSDTPTVTPPLSPTRLTHVAPYVLEINPQLPLYTLVFRALPCDPSAVVAQYGWVDVYREGALLQTLSLESDRGIVNCCDGGDCPMENSLTRLTAADINFDGYLDFGYDEPGGAYWGSIHWWLFDEASGLFYTNALTEELAGVYLGAYQVLPQTRELRFRVTAATHGRVRIYRVTADERLVLMYDWEVDSGAGPENLRFPISYTMSIPSMTGTTFTAASEHELPPKLWWSLLTCVSHEPEISAYSVQLLSWECAEWPDSCLGVPGDHCEEGTVSGYRIWVDVGGREVEYHCAASEPYRFMLAAERVPGIEDPVLIWERRYVNYDEKEYCSRLELGKDGQGVAGSCDSPDRLARVSEERVPQLTEMVARFAPFQIEEVESERAERKFIFQGWGEIASPAWQRAITRWADRRYDEARRSSRSCAACETALFWWLPEVPGHPLGYCGHLVVLDYGRAGAWIEPCGDTSGHREFSSWAWLDTAEWEAFDRWLYSCAHFCVSSQPGCSRSDATEDTCDELSGLSCFSGLGSKEMSDEEIAELTRWAEGVFAQLTD